MTFWLTALLVWMAAGARVGRVLVKPATTARVAIVIAVASVAAASTVAIPDVAVAVDHIAPAGVRGMWLSDRLTPMLWTLFVTATSVVAAAAWPVVSRRNLRQISWMIYAGGLIAMTITLVWSTTFGWVVALLGCVFIVVTGVRNLDWTTLGRGIALYTTGTLVVGVLSTLSLRREIDHAAMPKPQQPDWFWPAWQIASLLIAMGAVWIVIELWLRARLLLREIRTLHRVLVARFPEVVTKDQTGSTTQLKASDQVAQIMDALFLQSGGGVELADAGAPPESVAERAERVALWARNPFGETVVDGRWIAPPPGVSPRGWAQAIARAFDEALESGAGQPSAQR
ncbi:hypothetical protein FOH10_28515 [Nocardia otitidiscaviarum]|uniref:Uncharacterized protein n=1 Tax=Nocardia otitidiscaviarum TaxID=1823 RepID=A0A516NT58_9NOCA|nr:hypothetical protein [Nocardia otitidiscaviarum]MCP9621381.1 hypothetical protein [Nocardia otitidiscaviarum]QDP82089.1 hypothetical protein FOH10_28515 [Nocardia otitidiscaviarum]